MEKWKKLYFVNGLVNTIVSGVVFIACLIFVISLNIEITEIKASTENFAGLALILLIPLALIFSVIGFVFLIICMFAVLLLIQAKKGEKTAYKYRKMLIIFTVFAFILTIICIVTALAEGYILPAVLLAVLSTASGVYNIICYKEIKKSFNKKIDNTQNIG